MQVTLGRGEGAVPEDFLHVAQVGLVLQKMRCARVPPQMAGHMLLYFRPGRVFFHDGADRVARHRLGTQRDEEARRFLFSQQLRPHGLDVGLQKRARDGRQRHDAVLAALARQRMSYDDLGLAVKKISRKNSRLHATLTEFVLEIFSAS